MRAKHRLEEVEAKRIAKVVLQGLVPMHEKGVAYAGTSEACSSILLPCFP